MCSIAASTPSTTLAEITASRYSVDQSSSRAGPARRAAAVMDEHRHQWLEMSGCYGAVNEQRLGGATDAGTAHLGVEHDRLRHVEGRRLVDVDMADAFEMRKTPHAR